MYLITQFPSNNRIFFPLSERGDPAIQTALAACGSTGQSRLVCLCKGMPGAPMWAYASQTGELYPRRVEQTAQMHATSCRHGASRDLSSAYGAAPGAFSEVQGHPLIDLSCLFRNPSDHSEGGGGGKYVVPSRAPGMLSLGWFLMAQAGLTVWHPDLKGRNPWRDLYVAARDVRVKAGKTIDGLDRRLLLPTETDPRQAAFNYAKLRDATRAGRHVIVMALLPPRDLALRPNGILSLRHSLGAIVTIFPETLDAGLSRFSEAARRWQRGIEPVLLVGLAKPKIPPSPAQATGRLMANVEHFALMSVSADLVPVPSLKNEERLCSCTPESEVYTTGPEDDGMLRLWSARHGHGKSLAT
jgi:hypothetical protein